MQTDSKPTLKTPDVLNQPEDAIRQGLAWAWNTLRSWKATRWTVIGRDALDAALICGAVNILLHANRFQTTPLYPMFRLQQNRMLLLGSIIEGAFAGCVLAFICHLGMAWMEEREKRKSLESKESRP